MAMRLAFRFLLELAMSGAFIAVGLLIAFCPAIYARWIRWSNVEYYAPWLVRGLNVYSWRSRSVGIWLALFGVVLAIMVVRIHWFQ